MRERTTWNREEVIAKAAALSKKADPYTMNQPEHAKAQPAADKYENGNPSTWAEDIADPKKSWEAEYSGGQVKRNEIGMPEMRSDTFNHAEKTASDAALDKKAAVCVSLARKVLPKTASDSTVEDQAFAFMHMPDAMLVETFARLAAEDEKKEAEEQAKDEGQKKQAQQDEKKDESKDQGQKKEAQDQQDKKDESKADEGQKKEAQDQQDEKKDEQAKQATAVSASDIQQMIQAGIQAAMQQMQQQMMSQQQPQAPAQAPAAATYSDDQMLDQLLADGGAPMQDATAEMGIELDAPMMDVESSLGPEDAVLKTLFANDESKAQEEQEEAQGQGKQAGVRTASTRTVGTRPSAGVSRIGGAPAAPAAGGNDVARLSSMWASAPDVSDVFGTNKGY